MRRSPVDWGIHPSDLIHPRCAAYVHRQFATSAKQKLPKAKIIWANSTPVTVKGKPTELDPAINPVIIEHNRMAANVMKEMNVPVNDFYSPLVNKLDLARGDQFHWKPDAYKILAQTATDSILRELKGR
jgi:hypothetical protein